MKQATIKGMRAAAEAITIHGRWMVIDLVDGQHFVRAFDLTQERAVEWARYYRNGRAMPKAQYDALAAQLVQVV